MLCSEWTIPSLGSTALSGESRGHLQDNICPWEEVSLQLHLLKIERQNRRSCEEPSPSPLGAAFPQHVQSTPSQPAHSSAHKQFWEGIVHTADTCSKLHSEPEPSTLFYSPLFLFSRQLRAAKYGVFSVPAWRGSASALCWGLSPAPVSLRKGEWWVLKQDRALLETSRLLREHVKAHGWWSGAAGEQQEHSRMRESVAEIGPGALAAGWDKKMLRGTEQCTNQLKLCEGTNRLLCLYSGIWGQVLVAEGAAGVAAVRILQKLLHVQQRQQQPAPGWICHWLSTVGMWEHLWDIKT